MIWPDLRDMLKAQICLKLHIVAYLNNWALVEYVICL